MWLQGFDNAPMIVKKCYASWATHNPGWKIVFLDEDNIDKYIDLRAPGIKHENITKQAFSDLARINLLAQHGGIWVDATCFCCVSLDTWLNEYMDSGFFAFYKPGRDRLISSWFLACTKNCHLVSKWRDESNEYWSNNNFSSNRSRLIVEVLTTVLSQNTNTSTFWFSLFVRKIVKAYPYFWFHYLFGRIVRKDKRCRQIWTDTKKYRADVPHKVQSSGLLHPLSNEIKRHIDEKQSPLYKLSWKYNVNEYKEGCTLHYLVESALLTGK
jgi:capsular polysaccharide synthesis protein